MSYLEIFFSLQNICLPTFINQMNISMTPLKIGLIIILETFCLKILGGLALLIVACMPWEQLHFLVDYIILIINSHQIFQT